jgi:hypothetical protein
MFGGAHINSENLDMLPSPMDPNILRCLRSTMLQLLVSIQKNMLEYNPHPFYCFRGLKIRCGLDSRSRAGFWKNDRAGVLTFFRLRRGQKLDADLIRVRIRIGNIR